MGSCCSGAESPCGSAEERSGLLQNEKNKSSAEKVGHGASGPEEDENASKAAAKNTENLQTPENGDDEQNNTQENGSAQRVGNQTATPTLPKVSEVKENAIRTQTEEKMVNTADEEKNEHPKCTLNSSPEIELVASTEEPTKEDPVSLQEKENVPQAPEAPCPRRSPHLETNTPEYNNNIEGEISKDAIGEDANQLSESNTVLSEPNAADQEASISADKHEANADDLRCTLSADVDHKVSTLETHDGSESPKNDEASPSRESEQTGLDCEQNPETTDTEDRLKSDLETKPDLRSTNLNEVTLLEENEQDSVKATTSKPQAEDEPGAEETDELEKDEETENVPTETETSPVEKDSDLQEVKGEKAKQLEDETEEKENVPDDSDEDLYRGEEELSPSQSLKLEDRCSLSPPVDILFYSEREWKGNTAKSALIRKGYKDMSQRFGGIRRVRGDNYCALRATLFQVLCHITQLPVRLQEDVTMLPEKLEEQYGLINQWRFPGDGAGDATQQLKGYMELLQNTWQAAARCDSAAERQQLCERVFQGGEEELGMLEALKLLMLERAVELHARMQRGDDVPLFCWLLFARDSSDCPRSFLSNHLRHVGVSAGLEQVEMFLLGYALQCTIQVYRLYKVDTEEFVTYYPDDHKDDWQSVCLVTEDDRHYNVPVLEVPLGSS